MRALMLFLAVAVLVAPGAHADDVWVSLQGGVERHRVYRGAAPLEGATHFTAGVDVDFPLGAHVALRPQLAYVRTGGGLQFRSSVQELDLHLLDAAALVEASVPLSFGDRVYVLAGPALGVRLNNPATLFGPQGDLPGPPAPLEEADRWRRLSLSVVFGGGLAIRSRSSRLGTFVEFQHWRSLTNLYGNPDTSDFVPQYLDKSRGWRLVSGLSIAVR